MQFEWNGTTYATEFDLVQAVYRANSAKLAGLSTKAAAAEIVTSFGHDPRATGMFADQRMEIAKKAIDAVRDNPVTDRVLEIAAAHEKAVKAAFKGDNSDWSRAYRKATTEFASYLKAINRGLSVEEAEAAVS